ncbi:MAG TPA: isochorismatase family protein [Candidatus Acidoferrales bacterium]|nr:isochorismatase family protein [Candidatus Acidoferrales bacterium]
MFDTDLKVDSPAPLLLDIQNGFLRSDSSLVRDGLFPPISHDRAELTANLQSVVNAMRQAGRPVFYINSGFRADKADCYFAPAWRRCVSADPHLLVEGSDSAAVIEGITPRDGEFIMTKKGHSAFQSLTWTGRWAT